jgi:hypothetical protein
MGGTKDKEGIAEICGAVMGDGWIEERERGFFIAGDSIEDREYYDQHFLNLINKVLGINTKTKNFPYWRVYGISLYKKKLIEELLSFGLAKGKKTKSAYVPEWILNSNRKIKNSFIRGLFDTDGCVFCQKDYTKYANEFNSKYHTKIRIRIGCISSKLINQVSELCENQGFRVTKRILKRGFSYHRNRSDTHILEINELNSVDNWFNKLKPANPKHTTKYQIWKKFGFCPPRTSIQERKDILKNRLNPYNLYAGVSEWSNEKRSS